MKKKEKINVGEMYYLTTYSLIPWAVVDRREYPYGDCYDYKLATFNPLEDLWKNCLVKYIKVKYCGNGEFREELTNIRIQSCGRGDVYQFSDNYKNNDLNLSAFLDLDDFLYVANGLYCRDESVFSFDMKLKQLTKKIQRCAMCFDDTYSGLVSVKEAKDYDYEEQLEERKEKLKSVEKDALVRNLIVIKELSNAHSKLCTITDEIVAQANEENRVFNLTHNNKGNQDS